MTVETEALMLRFMLQSGVNSKSGRHIDLSTQRLIYILSSIQTNYLWQCYVTTINPLLLFFMIVIRYRRGQSGNNKKDKLHRGQGEGQSDFKRMYFGPSLI